MSDQESLLTLINEQKIDSRLKGYNGLVTHPVLNAERTYCVVCSKPKGWVSTEDYAHITVNNIVVICDECVSIYGAPDLPIAPIEEV